MGLPAMRDASQRRAGELHNVDRNVIWWPVRSQVRSQVTDHGGAGTAPLYADSVRVWERLQMEHINYYSWIVMLRFTVVPLAGFEAFGVVSAGGATSTYRLTCTLT